MESIPPGLPASSDLLAMRRQQSLSHVPPRAVCTYFQSPSAGAVLHRSCYLPWVCDPPVLCLCQMKAGGRSRDGGGQGMGEVKRREVHVALMVRNVVHDTRDKEPAAQLQSDCNNETSSRDTTVMASTQMRPALS